MATANTMKPMAQPAPVQPVPVRDEHERNPVIEVQSHEAPQWSDGRAEILADEKQLTADFFAEHEFLLPSDVLDKWSPEEGHANASSSEENRRNPSASIIVNAGTQPNQVVNSVLAWVE